MTPDSVNFEVSKNIVKDLFDLAELEAPDHIDDQEIIKLTKILKRKLNPELPPSTEDIKGDLDQADAKSILVVDDLGLVVYQLSLLLTKSGYNVLLARSTPEAFSIFEERGPFDFVLMDLFMPNKEDGIELLTKIKACTADNSLATKVIVMSATKDLEAIEEVISLGADSFLEKGQNWKVDLIETIENL